MNDIQKDNGRGVLLMLGLAVYCLLYFFRLLSILFASSFQSIYKDVPSWIYGFNIAIFLLGSIGLIAIFSWKKWGVYLLGLVTMIPIIIDFTVYTKHPTIVQLSMTLGFLTLLLLGVKSKWKDFN